MPEIIHKLHAKKVIKLLDLISCLTVSQRPVTLALAILTTTIKTGEKDKAQAHTSEDWIGVLRR